MSATLSLHSLFTDHAVLPRDVPLPVFGRAVPGQTVKVSLAGQQVAARADGKGWWVARFEALPGGGPHTLTISMANQQLIRRDLFIGDVWLATGQGNMELPLGETPDARTVLSQAVIPRLRLFTVPPRAATTPERECEGRWENCTADTARGFSGVGFHFGRMLLDALECPIGIVQATWAGTTCLPWMPAEALRQKPELAARAKAHEKPAVATKDAAAAQPPSSLFNGMIAPLTAFPFRGVICYQGETEVNSASAYRAMFTSLIQGWRAAWQRENLPFLFVQLAGYLVSKSDPGDDAWAELREAQAAALKLPATGMVVAGDLGDPDTMFPRAKRAVGERLALAALSVACGRAMPHSGPTYAGHTIKDGAVHVQLAHTESGLRARQPGPLMGFAVAGVDRKFRWADARIEGTTVIVSHPAIAKPVAARYGWEMQPRLSLENGAGLPAAPFRTDDWPGIDSGRR